jgi:acyl carrier protein
MQSPQEGHDAMGVNERIREFIVTELMHEDGAVALADDESLLERGVLDSLGLLQVLAFLEQEYGFTVQDPDIIPENFESISAIATYVDRRRPAAVR